jgi:hypothetical protein
MRLEDIKLEPLLDTLRMEKIDDSIYFGSPVYKNRISNSRLGLLNPKQEEVQKSSFQVSKRHLILLSL